MYLTGEFRDKDELIVALEALKSEGLGVFDLDLFSEEPVEFRRGILDRPSKMSLASVAGAVAFGAAATAFVYFAQHHYPLATGGMPTFSFWATGVISFEMTMLGAILATFGWFLWESGLVRKRDAEAPVPEVAPGAVCLRVRCTEAHAGRVRDALVGAGAARIDRKEAA